MKRKKRTHLTANTPNGPRERAEARAFEIVRHYFQGKCSSQDAQNAMPDVASLMRNPKVPRYGTANREIIKQGEERIRFDVDRYVRGGVTGWQVRDVVNVYNDLLRAMFPGPTRRAAPLIPGKPLNDLTERHFDIAARTCASEELRALVIELSKPNANGWKAGGKFHLPTRTIGAIRKHLEQFGAWIRQRENNGKELSSADESMYAGYTLKEQQEQGAWIAKYERDFQRRKRRGLIRGPFEKHPAIVKALAERDKRAELVPVHQPDTRTTFDKVADGIFENLGKPFTVNQAGMLLKELCNEDSNNERIAKEFKLNAVGIAHLRKNIGPFILWIGKRQDLFTRSGGAVRRIEGPNLAASGRIEAY